MIGGKNECVPSRNQNKYKKQVLHKAKGFGLIKNSKITSYAEKMIPTSLKMTLQSSTMRLKSLNVSLPFEVMSLRT
jgi:hypothetical protein